MTRALDCSIQSREYALECPLAQLALQQRQLQATCGPLRPVCSLQASCPLLTAPNTKCQLPVRYRYCCAHSAPEACQTYKEQNCWANFVSSKILTATNNFRVHKRCRFGRHFNSAGAPWTDLGSVCMIIVGHPVAAVLPEALQRAELPLQQLLQLQRMGHRLAVREA